MPAPKLLYLDTARLGQMSELAQRLSISFIRLSAEEPFSLYFERFLRDGFESWPAAYQSRFPGLSLWNGIESLLQGIKLVAGASDEAKVVIASRSLWLVQCAARKAFQNCRRILTTDLSWPSYQSVLGSEGIKAGRELHCLKIRHRILHEGLGECELIDELVAFYRQHHCDGVFLPAVDSLGVRLPIAKIVTEIELNSELGFVMTDAAQALGHIRLDDVCNVSDFVIAGCHKWVRAYHPMGIGILGTRLHASGIREELDTSQGDDPLFQFLNFLQDDRLSGHMETVNLTPLFSCQGAISELVGRDLDKRAHIQRQNAQMVQQLVRDSGWNSLDIDDSMQCGIQLLASPDAENQNCLEQQLHAAGVRATVLSSGLVRISLPGSLLSLEELGALQMGLSGSGEFEGYPRVVQ